MGDVVEFKQTRKVQISVCDDLQNYQTFEAEDVTIPTIWCDEHEIWWGAVKTTVELGHKWSPVTITGPAEIAEAIRYGQPPIRVTFEFSPRTKSWWELHEAYVSTQSTEEEHVIVFSNCIKHEYD